MASLEKSLEGLSEPEQRESHSGRVTVSLRGEKVALQRDRLSLGVWVPFRF